MTDDELRAKRDSLLKEFHTEIRHAQFWGDVHKRAALGFIGIAIFASIATGITGLLGYSPRLVGLLSFIPGALALFATTFSFEKRGVIYRRKARMLRELQGRFLYQMDTLPSADEIATIHRQKSAIESAVAEDEEAIVADWKPLERRANPGP
jgi:hypothetical protein